MPVAWCDARGRKLGDGQRRHAGEWAREDHRIRKRDADRIKAREYARAKTAARISLGIPRKDHERVVQLHGRFGLWARQLMKVRNKHGQDPVKFPTASVAELKLLWEAQGGICALTGRGMDLFNSSLDHIKPVTRGGRHTVDNLQFTLQTANAMKRNLMLAELLELAAAVLTHHGYTVTK
jgi:5-methylcytosine-specific restriction endonuclease McrA